ncbi:MAG: aminomethyl-transferring glycine dehydrogenase [Bacteroidetes bacterium]|nr:glycine dehydrogenase (aminomethyl-transferring) [Bacteroidota bacterium]MBV6460918.1 Glycine dehydrogenase (decarboxylating) [Flavobacteriales bacterium]WKZ75685.1 MAG: aminomethyl-transferring glycine dehydrogenase [Vicingaceae bacterium]MCL4815251.1 aminomethyl-transferring glycine dehydrogenase [Flavobacteriales bacterium]NOG94593.1 aminomethyl-transferring glycine dehydrogenase [Bacteroidota bacterium]
MNTNFASRHIGPRYNDLQQMLEKTGVNSLDELIDQTIPSSIRLKKTLSLPEAMSEYEYMNHIEELGSKNKTYKSYIGLGYYNTILPNVIKRNILENPGWYTAYTPYQAEISQGRLEALLNFQTMVSDLTGLPIANASLLDEATAASEAMIMFYNNRTKEAKQSNATKFFVSEQCFPQTIDVIKTRALPLGIEPVIGNHENIQFDSTFFGAIIQYPAANGEVFNYSSFVQKAHASHLYVAVAADILSLAILTPPGEWGADAVLGSTQRFGIPMGYGGPHAAYLSVKDEFKRAIPGRIIGVSIDASGNRALRMALQTREQHIKRDKATSNICTAQVLLAVMAGMYAVYHGKEGVCNIAQTVHNHTAALAEALSSVGIYPTHKTFFDTLHFASGTFDPQKLKAVSEKNKINFRYNIDHSVCITLDETTTTEDLNRITSILSETKGITIPPIVQVVPKHLYPSELKRKSAFLTHPVFNTYHSETEMMRYIKSLENKDISLVHSMISLGSCTMKLNAASELIPLGWSNWANIHPFVPKEQAAGYQKLISNLEKYLSKITGFYATSLQPNSGAQGEYAGLMVIRAYHLSRGDAHRTISLIPSSAHGTNPASAVMAGMQVVVVKCDDKGNIDISDLKTKADQYKDNLSCLMVTYPSTHGVYEEGIKEITKIIHKYGGQVYMDGANMNAQVGLTSPANIGADVCHLNLHKTFAIPHGGGGPGVGPICVAKHLAPFLPSNPVLKTGGENAITAVSAAPYGSALVLLISYGYIRMLGAEGLTQSTKYAILNANYIKSCLQNHYKTLYTNKNGRVAHEMILDCHQFKSTSGVEVGDIAKRLMDYGYHAPTVSFPVHDTIMVEPTESEPKSELDKFISALIQIRKEIDEIAEGLADKTDNVLKNSPHTADCLINSNWPHSYTREKAAYPVAFVKQNKFWPSVRRVDNAYGDRNLVCSCLPIEEYEKAEA